MLPGCMTVAGTGGPAPMVRNIVDWSSAGCPLTRTFVASPPVTDASLRHGCGAAVANGHGAPPGIEAATSPTVRTGAPPTMTFGATVGMILNMPPCEHITMALALRSGGTRRACQPDRPAVNARA